MRNVLSEKNRLLDSAKLLLPLSAGRDVDVSTGDPLSFVLNHHVKLHMILDSTETHQSVPAGGQSVESIIKCIGLLIQTLSITSHIPLRELQCECNSRELQLKLLIIRPQLCLPSCQYHLKSTRKLKSLAPFHIRG